MSATCCLQTNPELAQAFKEIRDIASEREMPPAGTHEMMRIEMAHVHWWLLNYLESAWEGASKCEGDEKNFVQYACFALRELDRHHSLEENMLSPYMQQRGVKQLEENIAEHKVMHAQLDTLLAYLNPFLTSPAPTPIELFSPTHLQGLLDALLVVLVPHLRHELETLTVEKLQPFLTREDLLEIDRMTSERIKSYPPGETLPGAVVNFQPGTGFPAFPWFLRRILVPLKFSREYKGCWKYGKFPREIDLW